VPRYLCFQCGRETGHFNVLRSSQIAQVTRTTIYNWICRGQLHYVIRPSGRKFICVNSLIRPAGVAAGGQDLRPAG
jgi:hypothetical protein